MRDSLWGIFGSRKSLVRAILYDAAIAAVVASELFGVTWAARWNLNVPIDSLPLAGIAGVVAAISSYIIVRMSGPATIRDTMWAMLETETA
jgi:hypothetical protein